MNVNIFENIKCSRSYITILCRESKYHIFSQSSSKIFVSFFYTHMSDRQVLCAGPLRAEPDRGPFPGEDRCSGGARHSASPPARAGANAFSLVFRRFSWYTVRGLRNAAKGGAPWRHAHIIDDKNQIAREPVFQAERVPVRADRTRLPAGRGGPSASA